MSAGRRQSPTTGGPSRGVPCGWTPTRKVHELAGMTRRAVAALLIALWLVAVLMLLTTVVQDRLGVAYDCPSALKMLTNTRYVAIHPDAGSVGENAKSFSDTDVPVEQINDNDSGVYYACQSVAHRMDLISTIIALAGGGFAVYCAAVGTHRRPIPNRDAMTQTSRRSR
jgi:hypothetical protein